MILFLRLTAFSLLLMVGLTYGASGMLGGLLNKVSTVTALGRMTVGALAIAGAIVVLGDGA